MVTSVYRITGSSVLQRMCSVLCWWFSSGDPHLGSSLPKSYNFRPLKYNFDDYVQYHTTNILNSNYRRNIIAVTIAYYFLTSNVQFCYPAALAADLRQHRELQPAPLTRFTDVWRIQHISQTTSARHLSATSS